ncbi:hypothetical protein NEAUS04_1362 [Nematocida ausubeli]|nr:hypothetical protein NEAUS06_1337 [Nematocida ausubeli]KAI5146794.1 hypothetical protein NEAUS05_0233 [Nematocida ausubeli]KAI5163118.1 hypothetical protein NEAUS04_1362 [Nematocida ausubeli]
MDEIERILSHKGNSHRVLNLPKECTKEDIRKSYKKLAVKVHPDRNSHPNASEAFIILQKAYEDLIEDRPRFAESHTYRSQHNVHTHNDIEEIIKWYTSMGAQRYGFAYQSFNAGPYFREAQYRRTHPQPIELSNRIAITILIMLFVYSLLR